MRKVELRGWVIFNESELSYKTDIVGQISHELYNVDGVIEWNLTEVSNKEIEYEEEGKDEK